MSEAPSHQPRILLIYTGGTIGMIENPVTGVLEPFDFTHLIDNVPKIKMLNYRIDNISFDHPIDSSDVCPDHWVVIARAIEEYYDDYDEENLITAIQIAAATDADGDPMVQEVAILFENYLWRGNRATKRSADNFNAFKSHNYPELAKIASASTITRRRSCATPTDRNSPSWSTIISTPGLLLSTSSPASPKHRCATCSPLRA